MVLDTYNKTANNNFYVAYETGNKESGLIEFAWPQGNHMV